MEHDDRASTGRDVTPERQGDGTARGQERGPRVRAVLTTSEMRRRHDRAAAGALVAFLGLLLVAAPAFFALLFGLDSSGDACVDAWGGPCDGAPQAYALAVGLVAAPLLLGLAIARPRRARGWLVATVGGALVLFVVLLVTT